MWATKVPVAVVPNAPSGRPGIPRPARRTTRVSDKHVEHKRFQRQHDAAGEQEEQDEGDHRDQRSTTGIRSATASALSRLICARPRSAARLGRLGWRRRAGGPVESPTPRVQRRVGADREERAAVGRPVGAVGGPTSTPPAKVPPGADTESLGDFRQVARRSGRVRRAAARSTFRDARPSTSSRSSARSPSRSGRQPGATTRLAGGRGHREIPISPRGTVCPASAAAR